MLVHDEALGDGSVPEPPAPGPNTSSSCSVISVAGPERMRAVFRYAVRRPALLGLVREVDRLGPSVASPLAAQVRPLVDRAAVVLDAEMAAGTLRGADPRVLLLPYTLVVGVATDVQAQGAVGLPSSPNGLRRLRRELFGFVRAALRPDLGLWNPTPTRAGEGGG